MKVLREIVFQLLLVGSIRFVLVLGIPMKQLFLQVHFKELDILWKHLDCPRLHHCLLIDCLWPARHVTVKIVFCPPNPCSFKDVLL